jgi:hypothetical protein
MLALCQLYLLDYCYTKLPTLFILYAAASVEK